MLESAIYPYPEHWKLTTLGQLCSDGGGRIQTGPFGSQLHAADYVEIGIPSIMPKNISIEGVSTEDIARITKEDALRLSKYLVKEGDIIYSRRGDVEKCSLITEREHGWLCGTGCLKVSLGANNKASPLYIHAYLSHPAVREWISRHAVGATMPNLNTSILSAVPVLIPPADEVDIVINVWRNTTDKIILNRQTNQTLEQIAQALFKSWFVDFEPTRAKIIAQDMGTDSATQELAAQAIICGAITLEQLADTEPQTLSTWLEQSIQQKLSQANPTGINPEQLKTTAALFPNALVESELGGVPEGWQLGSLENICFLNKASWTRKTAPPDIWYVDLANTKNGVIEELTHYTWKEAPSRARRILDDGDTIVGTVRPGNRSFSFIVKTDKQLTASTGFAVLTPKQKYYKEYIYLSATSAENIDRLTHLADGGAYPAVRPDEVVNLEINIPTEELMIKFSDVVSPLFNKRGLNLQSENILKMLRDTLLPKLLSGELSLAESE